LDFKIIEINHVNIPQTIFYLFPSIDISQEGHMNKADLVEALRKEIELAKNKAKQVVEIFFDEITQALVNSDRVEIRGFCSFYAKKYKGYSGRNPKTGESIEVKPKKLPFFKCGQELKERVDDQER
jgi:integration host factor subunit beta